MKKKVLIALFIIIGIIIVLFLINYIKEKKDASTDFLLDSENKYILSYERFLKAEGGLYSSNYYCEIDFNNKYIECRYDLEYLVPNKVRNNKKRKLVKRYILTDNEKENLKKLFERFIKEPESNNLDINVKNTYYFLESLQGSIVIMNPERKEELKQNLKNIDKKLYSFLLKE